MPTVTPRVIDVESQARRPLIEVIETTNLGDRSYVVHLDGFAVVVDPQRDIDRVDAIVDRYALTVTHVIETHIHNDYVSGGKVLAGERGAVYVIPAGYALGFEALQLADGGAFTSGEMQWRALHTPGHTPQHLSYVVSVDGRDSAAFTGGSMLFGSVGRTDLIGPALTKELSHSQWHSVRRLTREVEGSAAVLPTHGFGSFCSATATSGLESTMADQARANPACLIDDEEAFVSDLIAGLDVYPSYYAHMGPANQAGPGPVDLSLPRRASADELTRRMDAGEWVIDLRSRKLFAQGHLRGTLSFDLAGNAVTYLGWLIPWGTPLTLLGETPEQIQAMQRELVRIGIDRPAAYREGSPHDWITGPDDLSSYPRATFQQLDVALHADTGLIVVDARRRTEWLAGHVTGARHIPLHDFLTRIGDIESWTQAAAHAGRDVTVWVYCGSGFRASVAASLLERSGITVVHVDEDIAFASHMKHWTPAEHVGSGLGAAYAD